MTVPRWVSPVLLILGLLSLASGIDMFFFPSAWFWKHVPGVPETGPFNAHLVADGGTFNLGLGIGLVIASRDPIRHYAVIVVCAVAGVMHSILHLWSHETGILSWDHAMTEVFGIYIPAVILVLIANSAMRANATRVAQT